MRPSFPADTLRSRLSPLTLEPVSEPTELQDYRRLYQLDRLPNLTSHHMGRLSAAGYDLVAQLWLSDCPRGTLFLLHGYYDHLGIFRHLIAWGLSRQLAVLGCDLPGHGLSCGERASIRDFGEYQTVFLALLDEARRLQLPQPWHMLGQSMGGAILLDFLLKGDCTALSGQAVLLAPLIRPHGARRAQMAYQTLRHFMKALPRNFTHNSNDPVFLDFLKNHDPLQPKVLPAAWAGAMFRWIPTIEKAAPSDRVPLVIQGNLDQTVDWQHNLNVICDKFPGVEPLMLAGARHHLSNEIPEYRERYLDYLDTHLPL